VVAAVSDKVQVNGLRGNIRSRDDDVMASGQRIDGDTVAQSYPDSCSSLSDVHVSLVRFYTFIINQ